MPGIGICSAALTYWDATDWGADGMARALKPQHKDKKAFVQDGSDYMATLKTLPDFGCVMHAQLAE